MVHLDCTDAAKVAQYEKNKTALTEYIGNAPLSEIEAKTGLSPLQVRRLAARAASRHPLTNQRYGWCVCAPDFQLHVGAIAPDDIEYTEEPASAAAEPHRRSERAIRAGAFRTFLQAHPAVLEFLLWAILKGKLGRSAPVTNPKLTDIHDSFKKRCRIDGVTADQYPLCTSNEAFESLRRFRERVLKAHPEERARLLGGASTQAALALQMNRGEATTLTPAVLPMERWEQDTWTVDALMSVLGKVLPDFARLLAPLRLQLHAAVDRGSGAVCGFELFAEDAPTALSRLLQATFTPHVRRRIRAFDYPEGPCFPSEIEALKWCLPRVLAMDRASYQVQLRLDSACKTLRISPDFSEKKQPVDRIGVEGLFATLTSVTQHWPIATGNHPKSSYRREPERFAPNFLLALALDFFECFFALYNTMELPDGTTRMGRLHAAILDGSAFIMPSDKDLRPLVAVLLSPAFPVTINDTAETGAYVECKYERYWPEDESARATLTAQSAHGGTNLRLHILQDASRAVLCEVRGGVEAPLCGLKVLNRVWGRPHKLIERVTVKSIAKKFRVKVTSPTTVAGYLLAVLQMHGHKALGASTKREADRLIAQVSMETHGDEVQLTEADIATEDGAPAMDADRDTDEDMRQGRTLGDGEFEALDE